MVSERKQNKLQWFALHVDAFLEDPRMMHFSGREKGQWLLILVKMWRNGFVPDSIDAFKNLAECRNFEAESLRKKLLAHCLLIYEGQNLISPRLKVERQIAETAYNQKVEAGKRSAEAKAKLLKELQEKVNAR